MDKHRPSLCPSLWSLGSCNNSWTTGRSDCINCLGTGKSVSNR